MRLEVRQNDNGEDIAIIHCVKGEEPPAEVQFRWYWSERVPKPLLEGGLTDFKLKWHKMAWHMELGLRDHPPGQGAG